MAVIFLIYRQNVGRRRRLQILLLSVARKVQEQTVQSDRNVIDQPIQVPSPIPPVVVAKETSQWSNEKKKKKRKKKWQMMVSCPRCDAFFQRPLQPNKTKEVSVWKYLFLHKEYFWSNR